MKKLILFLLLLNSFVIVAQDDEMNEDLLELSLEELLNVTVDVAKTNLSMRETPAIISVITKEEIKNSGARDLVDVLKMVPGFHFGVDVTNVVGVGVRGNWGHEGKVLMLIDGMEMNENLFSTLQFGQHYNIQNIEKIEIIRGPGSSIYGGFAELGVINIITKTGAAMEGAQLFAQYGAGGNGTIRNTYNLNLGKSFTNGSFALSANYGWAQRSFETYEDVDGATTELEDGARLRPASINGKLIVGNFKANFMYDDYTSESADQYGWVEGKDNMSFRNTYTHFEYGFKVNESLTVTPSLNYKFGSPWATDVSGAFDWDVENDVYALYHIKSSRLSPSLTVNANLNSNINLLVGIDSYIDKAENTDLIDNSDYFGDGDEVTFNNIGLFGQGVVKTEIANFTLGARFDKHSELDAAFSPRLGVTKQIENFNFKLLYSKAFRAPGVENINFNNDIKPEFTDVLELELGYKLNENNMLSANLFNIKIENPIVYSVVNLEENYFNFTQAGSKGAELEYKYNSSKFKLTLNYALYDSKNLNEVDDYAVPGEEGTVLGLPNSMFNGFARINVNNNISINPSFNFMGKKYGVTSVDNNYDYIIEAYDAQFLANLFVTYHKGGFDAGVGIYDLLDQGQLYLQPYAGGHRGFRGTGREFNVRLSYKLNFK